MPRPAGRPVGDRRVLAVDRVQYAGRGKAPPPVSAPLEPVDFLDEARAAGVEVPAQPMEPGGNVYRCKYRGLPLDLLIRQRGVIFGVKVEMGTRRYESFTLELALEAINDELAGRRADHVETLQTLPGGRSLFSAAPAAPAPPAAKSGGGRPKAAPTSSPPKPAAVPGRETRDRSPPIPATSAAPPAIGDRTPPVSATAPGPAPRDPAPLESAARPRVDGEPRRFKTRQPIPLVGSPIPAGTVLTLTALHPARTAMQPKEPNGIRQRIMWDEVDVAPRGNFRTADGRAVCDYPLDQLEEVTG